MRERIERMIAGYQPQSTQDVGVRMKIVLKSEKPIYQSARRLSAFEREIVNRQIDEWIQQKIIRPSNSDYASPIVLVRKGDGK